jgi:peptide/nickel transport system permease protein
MIEVLQQDYVLFARLNGIPERRVLLRYALRNALAPNVQIIAQNLQYLVGGIIVVESVFSYPGIGTYLVNAVTSRDVDEVQAAAMILATLYVGINIVADLIVMFLVPRLRTAMS